MPKHRGRTSNEERALYAQPFSIAVAIERRYQHDAWDDQRTDELSYAELAVILGEEIGEVFREACELHFLRTRKVKFPGEGSERADHLRAELIQTAAVCWKIVDRIDADYPVDVEQARFVDKPFADRLAKQLYQSLTQYHGIMEPAPAHWDEVTASVHATHVRAVFALLAALEVR